MAKKKIEIQDSDGNIYYPHTSLDAVFDNDGKSAKKLLDDKVDKIPGKGLSTYDFTNYYKTKIEGVEKEANNYIHPNTHPASMITDLPAIVDTLSNTSKTNALSANQGKILKGLLDTLDVSTFKNNLKLLADDFNNAKDPGFYTASVNNKNSPGTLVNGTSTWGLFNTCAASTSGFVPMHQFASGIRTNNLLMRYYNAGDNTYSKWQQILTEDIGCKIATGFYKGTGNMSNENNIKTGFRPRIILIIPDESYGKKEISIAFIYGPAGVSGITIENDNFKYIVGLDKKLPFDTSDGFSVLYNNGSNNLNENGRMYHYTVLG